MVSEFDNVGMLVHYGVQHPFSPPATTEAWTHQQTTTPPFEGQHRMATDLNVVRYLCELPLDRGVDPSADNNSAVVVSIQYNGQVDVMQCLCELPLDRGVNPSADNNFAVRIAACRGRVDVLRYLCELPLDRGVDPSADNNYAVYAVARRGHLDVVRYLCELPRRRGVDPVRAVLVPDGVSTWANPWRTCLDLVRCLCELAVPRTSKLSGRRTICWVRQTTCTA